MGPNALARPFPPAFKIPMVSFWASAAALADFSASLNGPASFLSPGIDSVRSARAVKPLTFSSISFSNSNLFSVLSKIPLITLSWSK